MIDKFGNAKVRPAVSLPNPKCEKNPSDPSDPTYSIIELKIGNWKNIRVSEWRTSGREE
jgi:hypothetical protein